MKLSTIEDVSISMKLGICLILVGNVPLFSSIPLGKRRNHHQCNQTLTLIEQKEHDGKTEKRNIFRASLRNKAFRIPLSNISYLETINYDQTIKKDSENKILPFE